MDRIPFDVFLSELKTYIKNPIYFNSNNLIRALDDIVREIEKLENYTVEQLIESWRNPSINVTIGYVIPYGDVTGFGYLLAVGPFKEAINEMAMAVYKFRNSNEQRLVVSVYSFLACGISFNDVCETLGKVKCNDIIISSRYMLSAMGFAGAAGTAYRVYIDAPIEKWRKDHRILLDMVKFLENEGPVTTKFRGYINNSNINCKFGSELYD